MRIVKNGDVHVSAPIGMSKRTVEAFVNEHIEWIEEARKRNADKQKKRSDFYNQLPLGNRAEKDNVIKSIEPFMDKFIYKIKVAEINEIELIKIKQ